MGQIGRSRGAARRAGDGNCPVDWSRAENLVNCVADSSGREEGENDPNQAQVPRAAHDSTILDQRTLFANIAGIIPAMKLLLVEDDPNVRRLLTDYEEQ